MGVRIKLGTAVYFALYLMAAAGVVLTAPHYRMVNRSQVSIQDAGSSENARIGMEVRKMLRRAQLMSQPRWNQLVSKSTFPEEFYGFGVVISQEGKRSITFVRNTVKRREDMLEVIELFFQHQRTRLFDILDVKRSQLRFEFILQEPKKVDLTQLTYLPKKQLGPGTVHSGLRLRDGKKTKIIFYKDLREMHIRDQNSLWLYIKKFFRVEEVNKVGIKEFESKQFSV